MSKLGKYQHAIPPELTNASTERVLHALGEQGENARRQGVSVAQYGHWHVVARFDGGNRLGWIVVDTSPTREDLAPIKVMGPVRQREEAEAWAKATYEVWRMTHAQMPTWPWE